MVSTVLIIAYAIVLVIAFLATVVTGIVWLVLKPTNRAICGNILIVAASICALLGLLGVPVSNFIVERRELHIPEAAGLGDAIVTKADAVANAFEKSEAADLVKTELPFLSPFAAFLALPTQAEARESVKAFFDKLSDVDQHRTRIIERRNIFEHEVGLPFTKDKENEAAKHRSVKRLIAFIESVDKPISSDDRTEFLARTYIELPEGFYRYSLLKAIYSNAKDETRLQQIITDHQKHVRERMSKMLIGIALSYAIILVGLISLIVFVIALKSKSSTLFDSSIELVTPPISLRRIYCFSLLVYYGQFCMSFPAGFLAALIPKFGAYMRAEIIPVTAITLGVNLILIVLCAKFTIFDPLELKTIPTLKAYFSGNIIKAAVLGAGACCAVKALITVLYWLAYVLFQHVPSTNNIVNVQIASFSMAPNAINLVCLFLMLSVFAPLGEEFAFRGLLYTSIKDKFGVFAAIILSSAIFAAYHMDPGSFMGLFGVGIGLAFLFTRTKSLLPNFFMHATWNASFMLVAYFLT